MMGHSSSREQEESPELREAQSLGALPSLQNAFSLLLDSQTKSVPVHMAMKIQVRALKTLPNLADCLAQFVHSRLCYHVTHENKSESSCFSAQDNPSSTSSETSLLTSGRAWSISLTVRSPVYEEISKACFPSDDPDEKNENLIYRSSLHGKGLKRFWSNVEGSNGPVLVLISASEDSCSSRRWIIGALAHQGFENKELFYGNS